MTNAERIAELNDKIYNTGKELNRVSRAAADSELIADVLIAAKGDDSEAEAHAEWAATQRRYRAELLGNLRMMHSELAGYGVEA